MNTVLTLAKQLIELPSYVNATNNENAAMNWLISYITTNLPDMPVTKYPLDDGRFNVYFGARKPSIAFVGHMDTVEISDGWDTDPLQAVIKDDKLFGLGIADMKGGIGSLLAALQDMSAAQRSIVGVLIYVDEEYDFAGMKQAVVDKLLAGDSEPKLMISMDGNLEAITGCRGLLKIDLEVLGRSGHASNPKNGRNAITGLMSALTELEAQLPEFDDKTLGRTTMNVAYVRGGTTDDVDNPIEMQRVGNVIPNYAECVLEFRTTSKRFTGEYLQEVLTELLAKSSLTLKKYTIGIELGSWPGTNNTEQLNTFVKECYDEIGSVYALDNPAVRGYIDVQILAETIQCPIYVIGAGGDNRHAPNEYTPIANLKTATRLYRKMILRADTL